MNPPRGSPVEGKKFEPPRFGLPLRDSEEGTGSEYWGILQRGRMTGCLFFKNAQKQKLPLFCYQRNVEFTL